MKLIVGLGNPGAKYANNRHNVGFMALDQYAARANAQLKEGHKSAWAKTKSKNDLDIFLQKPMTHMNVSGEAVVSLAFYFKILPEDILVLHDELEFPYGDVRLKLGGGEGGHNGLKSISQCLGTQNYARVRIGVGRPPHPAMDVADYVLQDFSHAEFKQMDDVLIRANEAIDAFTQGQKQFQLAMNVFNRGVSK